MVGKREGEHERANAHDEGGRRLHHMKPDIGGEAIDRSRKLFIHVIALGKVEQRARNCKRHAERHGRHPHQIARHRQKRRRAPAGDDSDNRRAIGQRGQARQPCEPKRQAAPATGKGPKIGRERGNSRAQQESEADYASGGSRRHGPFPRHQPAEYIRRERRGQRPQAQKKQEGHERAACRRATLAERQQAVDEHKSTRPHSQGIRHQPEQH